MSQPDKLEVAYKQVNNALSNINKSFFLNIQYKKKVNFTHVFDKSKHNNHLLIN